jgi:glyoxylase-like metal-dependent hydrolase (beta-lactamase superfamily II)
VEAVAPSPRAASLIGRRLSDDGALGEAPPFLASELDITDPGNILRLEVGLRPGPGTLGAFVSLLRDHGANCIYLFHHQDVSPGTLQASLSVHDPAEIDRILKEMNEQGWLSTIHYRGAGQKEADDIIGLNLVERFYFRLQQLLGTGDAAKLRRLVESSRALTAALQDFAREAGRYLEAGEVYTRLLAFATASLSHLGSAFHPHPLPVRTFGRLRLHVFRLPTGANLTILQGPEESVMIDGGYGLYYQDVLAMLRGAGIPPESVGRIYLSHADADHAGQAGYFAADFGCRVVMHPAAGEVIRQENRVWGSATPLFDLNRWFTVLVNEFTRFRPPERWEAFRRPPGGTTPLEAIDRFSVAGHTFVVLEGGEGHVPGQVFFQGEESGLFFSGDFLLDIPSLAHDEREFLHIPRFMLTSTNADSDLFRRQTDLVARRVLELDDRLRAEGGSATVVPGHGDYYPARRLRP